jgi:hypothetical protein
MQALRARLARRLCIPAMQELQISSAATLQNGHL